MGGRSVADAEMEVPLVPLADAGELEIRQKRARGETGPGPGDLT